MNIEKFEASQYRGKIRAMAALADSLRKDKEQPTDVTLAEVVAESLA